MHAASTASSTSLLRVCPGASCDGCDACCDGCPRGPSGCRGAPPSPTWLSPPQPAAPAPPPSTRARWLRPSGCAFSFASNGTPRRPQNGGCEPSLAMPTRRARAALRRRPRRPRSGALTEPALQWCRFSMRAPRAESRRGAARAGARGQPAPAAACAGRAGALWGARRPRVGAASRPRTPRIGLGDVFVGFAFSAGTRAQHARVAGRRPSYSLLSSSGALVQGKTKRARRGLSHDMRRMSSA